MKKDPPPTPMRDPKHQRRMDLIRRGMENKKRMAEREKELQENPLTEEEELESMKRELAESEKILEYVFKGSKRE
ncbi:hypothetical protein [Endozoicomonas sp. 8E]|uniref:hypothetical protein n=1 Tax=Endozoicomonas sp. 8E TaxID=3035692 RepID=UPI002938E3E3|nr:hypothetical protein [Endozoicomonas sp. 8E]WOG26273.1 hypothetical protein P6910_17105 [Endozoicomonas sp. 8E]